MANTDGRRSYNNKKGGNKGIARERKERKRREAEERNAAYQARKEAA